MGEEPERLRALAESALLRPVRTRTVHGKLVGGGVRIGALEAGELAGGILALLAEVERLAGERDALEARLETRIEDDAVYRVYDEKATECDEWRRAAFNDRQKVTNAEAECERLAGRVAALEQTLSNGATYGETIAIRTWCSLALADVGGSE